GCLPCGPACGGDGMNTQTQTQAHTTPAAPAARGAPALPVWRQYYELTKPRVVQLIVFCALIGAVLAVPGVPTLAQFGRILVASAGIWLVAAAAAAFNCLIEKSI